jgi:hypothetical protein
MRTVFLFALSFAGVAAAQVNAPPAVTSESAPGPKGTRTSSAKHDVGTGAGDIGKGAAKGAYGAAKATGSTAVDLATLHPINAATDLGKGAVGTGKTVGVGAAKGTGKILRGTGKAFKHLF